MQLTKKPLKQGEMLCTTTIRIESTDNKNRSYTGTGFFYSMDLPDNNYLPAIITNKHVVEDCDKIKVVFTQADSVGNRTDKHFTAVIDNVLKSTILHPDPEVDLCCINISSVLKRLLDEGTHIHTYFINKHIIPSAAELNKLDAIEDILMVGYPDGLWDELNNLPIARRGITATDPKIDYEGRKEFLIDAACFEGSSGSPVYYMDKSYKKEIVEGGLGYKIYLLGILCAGPKTEIYGELDRPTTKLITKMKISLNLGFVISASELLPLEQEMLKAYERANG